MLAWVAVAVATAASCYDHQAPDADDIGTLTVPAAAVADGASIVTIAATVDRATPNATPITVTVSTGVVNFAAAPTDSTARQITLKNDGTGRLSTPWRVGTRAGSAVVTLAVGGATRTQPITLTPSQPVSLTLGLDTSALKLDGAAHAQATVFLVAPPSGGSVSDNTVVRFGFCCPEQTDPTVATTCSTPPAVTVPAQATATSTSATVTVGTQAVAAVAADAGAPLATRVFLIATTAPEVSCVPPSTGVPSAWASAAISLTAPQAPN